MRELRQPSMAVSPSDMQSQHPINDPDHFQWISFDCYGTLVDWETGISSAVGEVLRPHGIVKTRSEILALFADVEPTVQESHDYLEYRRVLREVMAIIGMELGIVFTGSELGCLADTLPVWPVFPEAVGALNALSDRHKLAVISNVDDDLFSKTADALNAEFSCVVTSQQVQSYKPNPRNFEVASERMKVERGRWVHVAESLYHDIGPANRLGITSVWVNRPDRGGATRPTDSVPDLVVPDLATLAQMMTAEKNGGA